MKNKFGRGLLAASALAVLLAAGFQGPAVADDLAPPPSSLIDSALDDVDAPAAQANEALEIPKNAANTVDYTDAELSLGLDIPASGRPATDELRTTFEGDGQDNSISVEPLANGMRALINIQSPDAPTSYDFDLSGDVADLTLAPDGSVVGVDSNANPIVTIPAPWAVDANGATVPTHYKVNGATLTQIVQHTRGEWAYGITADPSFFKVLKCAAALTVAGGSVVFSAATILKIRKIIKAAGGVKSAASRVIKGLSKKGSLSTKAKAGFGDLGGAVVAAAVVVLDIDSIKSHCG